MIVPGRREDIPKARREREVAEKWKGKEVCVPSSTIKLLFICTFRSLSRSSFLVLHLSNCERGRRDNERERGWSRWARRGKTLSYHSRSFDHLESIRESFLPWVIARTEIQAQGSRLWQACWVGTKPHHGLLSDRWEAHSLLKKSSTFCLPPFVS